MVHWVIRAGNFFIFYSTIFFFFSRFCDDLFAYIKFQAARVNLVIILKRNIKVFCYKCKSSCTARIDRYTTNLPTLLRRWYIFLYFFASPSPFFFCRYTLQFVDFMNKYQQRYEIEIAGCSSLRYFVYLGRRTEIFSVSPCVSYRFSLAFPFY